MNIRLMTIDDYDAVYDLWLATPGMGLNEIDDTREGIEKYLLRNPSTCFVAEVDDKIAGTVMSGHDGRRGTIYHMAVRIAERNCGIATALLDHAMDALGREGITKVLLVVFDKNEIGNAFWEARGFTKRPDLVYRNKFIRDIPYLDT